MAYRPKRRRVAKRRYSSAPPKRRRKTYAKKRSSSSKRTIVIQLVQSPMGAAMSTGTLGKKQATPLLRARF